MNSQHDIELENRKFLVLLISIGEFKIILKRFDESNVSMFHNYHQQIHYHWSFEELK